MLFNEKTEKHGILHAETALKNSLGSEEFLGLMAEWGHGKSYLQKGVQLVDAARQKLGTAISEQGDEDDAVDELHKALEAMDNVYKPYRKATKVILEDQPALLQELGVADKLKRPIPERIEQGRQFYDQAMKNPEIMEALETINIDKSKLQAGLALVEAAAEAFGIRWKEDQEAQQAMVEKDEALQALDEWYSRFVWFARIATREKPQLLEMLGIVVKR